MNGIDISAWQGDAGINLAKVPFDFCVIKATEGTDYKNRYFAAHCDKVLSRKNFWEYTTMQMAEIHRKRLTTSWHTARSTSAKQSSYLIGKQETTIYLVSRIWSGACSGAVMCRKRQALSH